MAKDLKTILTMVLGSGGEKKFFFAYGVGKRKDKKGDGELAVGARKPKKPDIEGALDGCKELMEGVCWVGKGAEDRDTIYFQCKGKKLSQMVVAKMALSAKHTTKKQFDFQIPTPEEEARVAQIKEVEGDEGTPDEHAAGKGQDLQGRLKALLLREKAIFDKDPTQKNGLLPFSQQAASLVPTGKPGAAEALDKLEAALAAIEKRAGGGTTTDSGAEFKKKLAEWTPTIKNAMTAKGPHAVDIGKLLAQATALSRPGGDMGHALARLTECHALASTGAAGDGAKEIPSAGEKRASGKTDAEEGQKTPQTSIAIWNQTKDKVDAEINRLCDFLRKTRDRAAVKTADNLARAMGLFKVDLTSSLINIDRAEGEQKKQLYPKVIKVLENYKKSVIDDRCLAAADANPFVRVNAKKPLLTALHQIQKHLEKQIAG